MEHKYLVTLFKIDSTHQNVRTSTVEGQAFSLPELGKRFFMTGKGLEFGTRLIETTDVKALARVGDSILFETRNSTYTLLITREEEVPNESNP